MRVAAVLLLLVLLSPLALADHVFSDTVLVVGRAIGSDELPLPGVPVEVSFTNLNATGRCLDFLNSPEVTSPTGDFVICRRAREIPTGASVTVEVMGGSTTRVIDSVLRHAWARVAAPGSATARDVQGDRDFAKTLRVSGRVFDLLPIPEEVEGVRVHGTPRDGETVALSLVAEGVTLARANATTNESGDFSTNFLVGEIPAGARVLVESGGQSSDAPASALFRRVDLYIVHESGDPVGIMPGTQRTSASWALVLVAIVVGTLMTGRRVRDS